MKFNYLIKLVPFLSTLLIIVVVNISNNKEYTKIKILIWNSPALSLGNYITLSTCSGFIISYFITTNLAKANLPKIQKVTTNIFKEQINDTSEFIQENNQTLYDNTLIERDIKDPSPTINASFRVIGRTIRKYEDVHNNEPNQYGSSNIPDLSEDEYDQDDISYNKDSKVNPIVNDWNDNSYAHW